MREAGGAGELPEEVEQVLLDVQGVEGIILIVNVDLVIVVEIILSWGQELAEVDLPVVG